ncbi:MAG TPA: DapH/DapD/GlmU-related protein [Mucilaginibacter sp.]|nr:DapH/DapD/GlmU-related protein [Mucilaginibacter sp.]
MQRQIKNRDNDIKVQAPVVITGAKHITIGKSFVANRNLRLQAITDYMGVNYNPQINIGNNVLVNPNCHITALKKITIGDNVLIASNVFISDHSHGRSDFTDLSTPPALRQLNSKGEIRIGNNVWIGQNVTILADVNVGDNVIIGANAVVTKDIPANSIVIGNPARVIRSINA